MISDLREILRMRLIIVSLVLMMILAACSTTDIATDAPFYTATARITEPIARPTEGSIGLPDFVGGDPQIVASTSTFQYTVSGDVSDAVTRGSIVYNYVEATGNVSARDKIFISTSDANASQQLSFEFSPGLVPDTYPLTSPADSFRQRDSPIFTPQCGWRRCPPYPSVPPKH
ncbi:MAG: hypothetical protein Q9P01_11720 [Anaerolineae bacterium]|nr:hypothetical protein [Anaerolineae bacterium]